MSSTDFSPSALIGPDANESTIHPRARASEKEGLDVLSLLLLFFSSLFRRELLPLLEKGAKG